MFFRHIHAFIVGAGPVFFFFLALLEASKKLRYLLSKKKRKCTFRPAPRCSFEAHSVTTYHINTRRFRLLGHIPHNLVDHPIQPATVAQRPSLRPSQRRSLTKKHPAFIKNKERKRRILRPSPLRFSGAHSRAVNKKKTRQDYSLWAILLIMSSTCGHFVFYLFAPKQLLAASVSGNATPVTIHCRLSRLIQQTWNY